MSSPSTSSSSSSSDSAVSTPARNSLSEKDIEKQISEVPLLDDFKPRRARCTWSTLAFYRIISSICIALFVCLSLLHHRSLDVRSTSRHNPAKVISAPALTTDTGTVTFLGEQGNKRWTISIPQNSTFPLPSSDYKHMCSEASRLRSHESTSTLRRFWDQASNHVYDTAYMDVSDAQSISVLPSDATPQTSPCHSSLTLIIDSTEASFGKTLSLIWLSYGFAKKEGKAFFLDDSHWLYGKYSSYFPPLPRPACSRPRAAHIVSCPLQARHLVITETTAEAAFELYNKHSKIFDFMRSGFESTFSLIGDDAKYAAERIQRLRTLAVEHNQPLIGMHIRRGDLRPFERQYSQDYLPLERFTDAAKHMLTTKAATALIMASDDPDIIDSSELKLAASPHSLHKSQERIQLATKLALDRSSPALPIREPGSAYVKHVDENAGWDGGFYTALFHSTGGHNAHMAKQRVLTSTASPETLQLREMIGRGYLLDLAVLSEADGVVCAVSSAACRLLAVMMGRDAVRTGKWVNVDDHRPWSWDGQQR